MTVYALKNKVTGKIYVGSTANLHGRIYTHQYSLNRKRRTVEQMQRDFDMYGWESFEIKIVGRYANWLDGKRMEKFYMQVLRTYDPAHGYNYKDRKAISPIADKDRRQAIPMLSGDAI